MTLKTKGKTKSNNQTPVKLKQWLNVTHSLCHVPRQQNKQFKCEKKKEMPESGRKAKEGVVRSLYGSDQSSDTISGMSAPLSAGQIDRFELLLSCDQALKDSKKVATYAYDETTKAVCQHFL